MVHRQGKLVINHSTGLCWSKSCSESKRPKLIQNSRGKKKKNKERDSNHDPHTTAKQNKLWCPKKVKKQKKQKKIIVTLPNLVDLTSTWHFFLGICYYMYIYIYREIDRYMIYKYINLRWLVVLLFHYLMRSTSNVSLCSVPKLLLHLPT